MSRLLQNVSELESLPVGTKVLDKDGDVLRRAPEGWTYRGDEQLANPGSVMHHRLLGQYMPMVMLDDAAPPLADRLAELLDDPNLTLKVARYLRDEHAFLEALPTANYILTIVKEHLK